ncbi:DUF4339 domain-containing protein [Undibacterium sp. WLX3042]|uniref:DUF4339 domain-containing protein n=1 Tax=Undibacterium sp. WLX3042 TaxID=3412686 RepID=UPI003C301103
MNDDNFFSINRLVEFGLGVAVAKQMTNSMNQALNNTHIAGVQTAQLETQHHYHVILDGKTAGPFSAPELSRLINENKVTKDSYVWRPGMSKWQTAENLPDVLRLVALAPPLFIPGGNNNEN